MSIQALAPEGTFQKEWTLFLWEARVGSAASSGEEPAFTPPAAFHIKAMAAMLWDITVNLMHFMVATSSFYTFHGLVQLHKMCLPIALNNEVHLMF